MSKTTRYSGDEMWKNNVEKIVSIRETVAGTDTCEMGDEDDWTIY